MYPISFKNQVKTPIVREQFLVCVLAGWLSIETVRNFVPWRILLRHWEAFFEHDGELAFDGVPFAD